MTPEQELQRLPANHPTRRAGRLVPNNIESSPDQRRSAAEGDLVKWFAATVNRGDLAQTVFSQDLQVLLRDNSVVRMCNYLPRGEDQLTLIRALFCKIDFLAYEHYQLGDNPKWDLRLVNEDGATIESRFGYHTRPGYGPLALALDTLLRYHWDDDASPWIPTFGGRHLGHANLLTDLQEPLILSVTQPFENLTEAAIWYPRGEANSYYRKAWVNISSAHFISKEGYEMLEEIAEVAREARLAIANSDDSGIEEDRLLGLVDELDSDYDVCIDTQPEGTFDPGSVYAQAMQLCRYYTTTYK